MRMYDGSIVIDVSYGQVRRWQTRRFDGCAQRIPGPEASIDVNPNDAAHDAVKADVRLIEQEEFAPTPGQMLLPLTATEARLSSRGTCHEETQHRTLRRPEAILDERREWLAVDVASWPAKFILKTLSVVLLRLCRRRLAAVAPLSLAFAHTALMSCVLDVEVLRGPCRRTLWAAGFGRHGAIRKGTGRLFYGVAVIVPLAFGAILCLYRII